MATRSSRQIARLGAITLLVLLIVAAAAFNLQKFPGFAGTDYHADFRDASGLHAGNEVQVAGIRVGRVNNLRIEGDHVSVDFDAKDVDLGTRTEASVEVLNLLGEKYLELDPKGSQKLKSDGTIPVAHTHSGYDVVSTLGTLTNETEHINVPQLSQALTQVASTLDASSPNVRSTFEGLSRLSQTISSRDDQITMLLRRADTVTRLLKQRRGDLVVLMREGNVVFKELVDRRQAIHSLLVHSREVADQLRGVARDNQRQIGPALSALQSVNDFLTAHQRQLDTVIHQLGPYANTLINVIGTGPWFDAYLPNMLGMASGEFKPGPRRG